MMPYMISAGSHYHWVERIEARLSTVGTLKLILHGAEVTDEQFNSAEITIFTEDQPLVERLVAAINGAADAAQDHRENLEHAS